MGGLCSPFPSDKMDSYCCVISSLLNVLLEAGGTVGLVECGEQRTAKTEGLEGESLALLCMGWEVLRQEGPCLSQAERQNSSARAASAAGMAVLRKASSCSTLRVR